VRLKINAGWQIESGCTDGPLAVRVKRLTLLDLLESVHHAWLRVPRLDALRPELGGVLVETQGARLVVSAIDGHRLARNEAQFDEPLKRLSGTVPGPFCGALIAALRLSACEEVTFAIEAGRIDLRWGDVHARCGLVGSDYPDIERLLKRFRTSRRALVDALRIFRYAAFDRNWRDELLEMHILSGRLVMKRHDESGESGESRPAAEVEIECVDAGDGRFAVNARYLEQALRSLRGEEVDITYPRIDVERFEPMERFEPILITSDGCQTDFRLVMPISIGMKTWGAVTAVGQLRGDK